jgi:hypothetical protein
LTTSATGVSGSFKQRQANDDVANHATTVATHKPWEYMMQEEKKSERNVT